MRSETLLVEIGTEELPPKTLNRLRLSLAGGIRKQLADAGLKYSGLECHATPRRLALVIEELADRQPDQLIERRGPAVKAAYDSEGKPSKALIGFMRSCDIEDQSKLHVLKTDKGSWLVYKAQKSGARLEEILSGILNKTLDELPIERRMRWGKSKAEFVRPVKWLVSLYGKNELPIKLFGLESGRSSMGHRFMSSGKFEIANADCYAEVCQQHYVKVNFEARRQEIINGIETIAAARKAEVELDSDLLDEVTALVEWPVVLAGDFHESFLTVPPEVLISAMKDHQRYFHLTRNGSLIPTFITVANIESNDPAKVISGNERVIRPRLSDAAFFYNQDTKTSLEEKVELLNSVVFQTELGTYKEKASRISALAIYIAERLNADTALAGRAGLLAKADLVSQLVGEFPDLQGIMGGYFARYYGEPNDVSKGISQHYMPNQSGAALPDGAVANSVALADKIDTLTGLFGIGQPPTGSRDPFALRRLSLGVIRICLENKLSINIGDCFAKSALLYNRDFTVKEVTRYVFDRLGSYYSDLGIGKDVLEAALAGQARSMNLLELDSIIQLLKEFRTSPVADKIVSANKRVANILKKTDMELLPDAFSREVATEEAELHLHSCIKKLDLTVRATTEEKMVALANLQSPIDRFFDEVMVMDNDINVRGNRLRLLRDLRGKFLELADLSLLQ